MNATAPAEPTPEDYDAVIRGALVEASTAPEPVLSVESLAAVITGVRFAHLGRCSHCGRIVYGWSDGGTIRMGVETVRYGEGVRWYSHYSTGGRRRDPGGCHHCGRASRPAYTGVVLPVRSAREAERQARARIWAAHPQTAQRAHRHGLAYGPNVTLDGYAQG